MRSMLRIVLLLLIASSLSAQTMREQYAKLTADMQQARQNDNKPAMLQLALQRQRLLNHSTAALQQVAARAADAGDKTRSISALSELLNMGQDVSALLEHPAIKKAFSPSELADYSRRSKHNATPLSTGSKLLTVSAPDLLTEDIAYDSHASGFFLTSVLQKKIVKVSATGAVSDFALSPSGWPIFALRIDEKHGRLWATEAALEDFTPAPKADWGRSAVLCFDLASGKLLKRFEPKEHTALADMVLLPNGDAIISDGANGGIYRTSLSAGVIERIDDGKEFLSPQTPALDPDGHRIFIPDYTRGIAIFDLNTRKVTWLDPQSKYALNGIDGLYYRKGSLISTQNGTEPERVVRWTLNASHDRIVSEQIVERSTPTLGDPTHGVIVGTHFYYIANSGWNHLDEHGSLKSGETLTSPLVMRLD